jgi:hypothetical protein
MPKSEGLLAHVVVSKDRDHLANEPVDARRARRG